METDLGFHDSIISSNWLGNVSSCETSERFNDMDNFFYQSVQSKLFSPMRGRCKGKG